jgi:hypothetical protein
MKILKLEALRMAGINCELCGGALVAFKMTNKDGQKRYDWICPLCNGGIVDGPDPDVLYAEERRCGICNERGQYTPLQKSPGEWICNNGHIFHFTNKRLGEEIEKTDNSEYLKTKEKKPTLREQVEQLQKKIKGYQERINMLDADYDIMKISLNEKQQRNDDLLKTNKQLREELSESVKLRQDKLIQWKVTTDTLNEEKRDLKRSLDIERERSAAIHKSVTSVMDSYKELNIKYLELLRESRQAQPAAPTGDVFFRSEMLDGRDVYIAANSVESTFVKIDEGGNPITYVICKGHAVHKVKHSPEDIKMLVEMTLRGE